MPAPYSGACLCGGFRVSISSEPLAVLSCFCEHCRKGAGGACQTIAKFYAQNVEITIEEGCLGEYTLSDTSSGNPKVKTFCRTCGCTMWTVPSSAKGKFYLIRTSLLDRSLSLDFKPQSEIFTRNRPAWTQATEGVAQWEEARK